MRKLLILAGLLLLTFQSSAQKYKSGPQVLSFHSIIDGTDQPYGIYLPHDYDENKLYPFVVMLHGAGSNHRLALRRVFGKSNKAGENDVDASLYFPEWEDVPYIVATPLARGTMGYQGVAEKDVWDMISDVKGRFNIDSDRTYLTGLSMGGGGTLWLGLTRPDFWAAIAPVCPAPPDDTRDYLPNALNLPVHFFHGDADPVVSKKSVDEWVENFKDAGAKVAYTVYPGVQHNSWENAYENGQIFQWFDSFKRNSSPKKIVFSTSQMKYNRSFWIELVGIQSGSTAKIKADIVGQNILSVETENVEAFTVLANDHLEQGNQITLHVNNHSFMINNFQGSEIIGIDQQGRPFLGEQSFSKTSMQAGPMHEIASERHIYVYGTLDNPDRQELSRRKQLAEESGNWSSYRGEFLGRVMVFPRVLADREVRESDLENSNLILFGTTETNRIIAQYADKLPLSFQGTEKQSLVFTFPNEQNMLLINSGLPFWEIPADQGGGFSILRSPAKTDALSGKGDWLYYDGVNTYNGYFDSHWKLKDADVQSLNNQKGLSVK